MSSGSWSCITRRSISASRGGRLASPPTAGSRNAGAIASTSPSAGARTSRSSIAKLIREDVRRRLRGRLIGAAHRASTSARSLSPRPLRQTRTYVSSSSRARASACAGSSAGMIPSERVRSRKAASASSSVARTYVGAPAVPEERVLRTDARVVEPGRDRVRVEDLPVVVREDRRARAVQDAGAAGAQGRCPRRLDADQPHVRVVDEAGEHADRIRAAADAGDDHLGEPLLHVEKLLPRLVPDHRLEVAHDLGVRVRADGRADQVVGGLHVRDPVADRLARRLLERSRPELDRTHLRAEQLHPLDVRPLPAHVLAAHVDDAFETEPRADGRRRNPVLSRPGLRDDALLAEPSREHRLAERVVELVRAGVEEILALQVEALVRREPLRARERRRPACVRPRELLELRREGRVRLRGAPAALELVERGDERLRDVATAVDPVGQLRAASTYARTASGSFTPGFTSSRELASTAHGRTRSIAKRTLSAASPPASMTRPGVERARSSCSGSLCSHGRSMTVATRSPSRRSTASRPRWPFSRS